MHVVLGCLMAMFSGACQVGVAVQADAKAWRPLFDGKTLGGWKRTEFGRAGAVRVEKTFRGGPGAIVVEKGEPLAGITWTRDVPKTNYEIALEAMKLEGNDFFLGLTFPVAESHATLILGGWGGGLVGISSIDYMDASENDTSRYIIFETDHWYKVRLRVTPERLEAWLDDKKIVDKEITGRKISLRPGEIRLSVPLGLATYRTSAAYRNMCLLVPAQSATPSGQAPS